MDINNLNFLPSWRDDDFSDDDEREERKRKEGREAAKALYLKWRELYALIFGFTENLANEPEEGKPETHEQVTQKLIYENAMIIAPKIGCSWCSHVYFTNGKCGYHQNECQATHGTG